ncbi:MAG: hypothetical protein HZC47_11000 [Methanobacterium sp.]|uniref:hypothetical protein n=1 Tax=Methanobacterium sp. TaxID=2164 RepID=UPI003D65A53B|nr:hypothetical protein [Methanobacterium sp.]
MELLKKISWRVKLGITLVLLSAAIYLMNYLVFGKIYDLVFYIFIDVAYIPLEVLFVILIIEWAISEREKRNLLQKLNMVIGSFFSEVGTDLLKGISNFDLKTEKIREKLLITENWDKKDFLDISEQIKNYDYNVYIGKDNSNSIDYLNELKKFLINKRGFMLSLLANPNLLEHDTFTDLLWAVFHLTEELENRDDLTNLPNADYEHLATDTERAYSLLVYEWLQYMEHLMNNYPYLFSLAMRTNPFDPDAKVEIQDIYSN